MNMFLVMDVTFCFLVTKDLSKQHIWRKWLDRLRDLNLKCKVITHVSPENKVKSKWLQNTLLPDDYLCNTGWGWIMPAILSLYTYAINYSPAAWYCLLSESCVPLVTPEKFIENFHAFKNKTFLSYCKAWWDPLKVRRANLHLLPTDYNWAHPTWCILCHDDLTQILEVVQQNKDLITILKTGHMADESFIAIFLYKINNFKNVINKLTTLTDWKRSPNGNNPYTFNEWTEADKMAVAELQADATKQDYMFIRKISSTFPDKVLNKLLSL